nr:site-specific DNA-methyltransferase [Terrisporobacter sp.]
MLFGQDKFTAETMLSNRKMHRYNLIWRKVLPSGFLNANRMPLREHEDIMVFYKKLPTYNPQKIKGNPCHSKGKVVGEMNDKQLQNNNYGDFKCVETKGDMKFPTSILEFPKPHPSIAVHPTQKPVELLEWLIKTYTNENEVVLDNCMGSGSTGVAAVNLNRKFIGIELEKEYFDIATNRIKGTIKG